MSTTDRRRLMCVTALAIAALATGACGGMQSALDPAGADAERIAQLTTWMTAGTVIIWLSMVALALAIPRLDGLQGRRGASALIVGGGVAFPIVVLSALALFDLVELPRILAPAPPQSLVIEIVGEQWWWRVRYLPPDGSQPIELANEIRLPVGRRIDTRLVSADVVHSFWIPALAGKVDMIPGRVHRLALEPTRLGTFRGACAEFCGTSHARMNLVALVMSEPAFEAWLARERQPARAPSDDLAIRGQSEFLDRGCAACHTVRGTPALGVNGPDLTHVRSRMTIAAGLLPNTADNRRRWIAETRHLKPDAYMPPFDALPDDTLAALGAYLSHLE